jgi:eukaryotic-like serine/threonine-protein kinase
VRRLRCCSSSPSAVAPLPPTFSFGLVAFELFAGRRAFDRPPVLAVLDSLAMPTAVALASLAPGLDAELARLIDACLQRSPAERPDAATGLAALRAK